MKKIKYLPIILLAGAGAIAYFYFKNKKEQQEKEKEEKEETPGAEEKQPTQVEDKIEQEKVREKVKDLSAAVAKMIKKKKPKIVKPVPEIKKAPSVKRFPINLGVKAGQQTKKVKTKAKKKKVSGVDSVFF